MTRLFFQNNKLSNLPWEIKKLSKLSHLFISGNQLIDIPETIGSMISLRVVKLCNNRILTLPDTLFKLQKLRLLDLSFNKLTYISPDVSSMRVLQDLRLWGNKLSDIPNQLLYADCRTIQTYLQSNERQRFILYSQYRNTVGSPGPIVRTSSRLSYKSTPRSSGQHAHSATIPNSSNEYYQRFAPLGFYENDQDEQTIQHNISDDEDDIQYEDDEEEFTSMFKTTEQTERQTSFTKSNEQYQLFTSNPSMATQAALSLRIQHRPPSIPLASIKRSGTLSSSIQNQSNSPKHINSTRRRNNPSNHSHDPFTFNSPDSPVGDDSVHDSALSSDARRLASVGWKVDTQTLQAQILRSSRPSTHQPHDPFSTQPMTAQQHEREARAWEEQTQKIQDTKAAKAQTRGKITNEEQ